MSVELSAFNCLCCGYCCLIQVCVQLRLSADSVTLCAFAAERRAAGDRGITAEDMEKSQHNDFNEDTTDESASVACSNIYGFESWTLRKNEETRLDAFEMKGLRRMCAGFVDSKENK